MVKTLLILNGHISHGLWQWVCWRHLQAHIKPDAVLGQGIGALNGWLIATGQHEKGDKLWQKARRDQFYRPRWPLGMAARWVLNKAGLGPQLQSVCSGRPLRRTIKKMVGSVFTYEVPFYCSKSNLSTGVASWLLSPGDQVWRDLYASAAVPGLYEPARFNGQEWITGAACMSRPLAYGVKTWGASLERVYVISSVPKKALARPKGGTRLEDIVEHSSLRMMDDLHRMDLLLAERAWPALDVQLIAPPESLGSPQSFNAALLHNRSSLASQYIRAYIAEHLE